MTSAIALIRGINVGGNNMIKMDALRACHEALGLTDVRTHLQSGNVVFQTSLRDAASLERRIEAAIEKDRGFRPSVVVRTAAELREAVARNPFAKRDFHPGKLIVFFLASRPDAAAAEKLRSAYSGPEEFQLAARELYVYYPDGQGRSKFTGALIERTLKTAGTGRNWNTVTKLLEMAEAG